MITNIINSLISQRHKLGLTQQQLADKTQLTQSVIARFESKKTTPQLNTLLKVANALECDIIITPRI